MFHLVSATFGVPFLLFLLPIAFLLFSLVRTHDKGIATASNEISGLPSIDCCAGGGDDPCAGGRFALRQRSCPKGCCSKAAALPFSFSITPDQATHMSISIRTV